ncbi:cupin domain-containing protein [Haliangium ochraceum]|uniref:Cupin 2 conserved barrel domain protein n=1 Tax=Haliangium ochraceum (strain DSM 14365 / JCM 11303 / SMP-2) TaxID=502025 RepID=D0LUL9_HALO1|nr:cupin domain-containing protein [Haliangium ochraceum]ACY13909.1 Cupin 2 conserved barrel domain protein [Haliangium ochraceum DSM 14365]
MNYSIDDLLIRPGAGETSATHLDIKIRSAALGGHFSVMEGTIEPRHLLAPHAHANEDQAVIVLSGELFFEIDRADGLHFQAAAGSYIVKPRGVPHAFWNPSDVPARYVELSTQDGFEGFVDSLGQVGTLRGVAKSRGDYDMSWYFEDVPRLMRDHALRGISSLELPFDDLATLDPATLIARVREHLPGAPPRLGA